MTTATIISQGNELLWGDVLDTNAMWLSKQLFELGVQTTHRQTIGDHEAELSDAFAQIAGTVDLCLCTGGLGPTTDDHTIAAIAKAAKAELILWPEILEHIENLFKKMNRPMAGSNEKQAWLPKHAEIFQNPVGTAPGFALKIKSTHFICLPGPPHELKTVFSRSIRPLIDALPNNTRKELIIARVFGLGESQLQERLGSIPEGVLDIGYRAALSEVAVKCELKPKTTPDQRQSIKKWLHECIGTSLYTIDNAEQTPRSLVSVVATLLSETAQSLVTAESCTGGQLSALCTTESGASAWFQGGLITYSNASKVQLLNVPVSLIEKHGAVSSEVASSMAQNARVLLKSSFALSTTGIAGPSGATQGKPLGTVYIALATPQTTLVKRLQLRGSRGRVQATAALAALNLLRKHLIKR